MKLKIKFREGPEVTVDIRPDSTPSVKGLLSNVPFRSRAQTWGDEVYFTVPFHVPREKDSRMEMEVGEVGYWPDGDAIAIFFGPTPASEGAAPMAYSPCNILGRVIGDSSVLRQVRPGTSVEVTKG